MFLALREITFARGRVGLMAGVVGLITLLLIMLTGLTGGLGRQNTSAIESLGADSFVFSTEEPSFTESSISEEIARDTDAAPLGVAQTRRSDAAGNAEGVALFGLPAGFDSPAGDIPAEGVIVPEDLGYAVGDTVQLGGEEARVAALGPTLHYSHVPVVWGSTATWQEVGHVPADAVGTVLISQDSPSGAAVSEREALAGLPAYSSERGSLLTMQGFLYAISALVTIAFLSVWTIQRSRDLSIVRALGATAGYLLRDSLGQAAILLTLGTGIGALAGWGAGWLAAGALPFQLDWTTVLVPAAGVWVLGMLGALLATRRVTRTDPMQALGGMA